jgi:hypothetical protein
MLRDEWKFEYTASKIAEAVTQKIAYHDEMLDFWKSKRGEVIELIRSEGIEVDEKIALAYCNPKARDWQDSSEVMIRNDLRKDVVECSRKLAYHTGLRDTYDGWKQVLEANPTSRQALDISDWLFFFGRDTSRDD